VRGRHRAEVEIRYTSFQYTIEYVSSQLLLAKQGTIHKNYNRWVESLDSQITLELQRLSIAKR
jgi:hypothetical protein